MSALEPYFIVMAAAVMLSIVGGIWSGGAGSVPAIVRRCLMLSGALAAAVLALSLYWPTDGFVVLLTIATFMYSAMISFAVAMTFRKLRRRNP